jgi:hypothetical protein
MRRNNPWREYVSGDLCWVGIAVVSAGVLFMLFRAAPKIDPRRPDGDDALIVYLASYSFLMIPCAVFVLLGIAAAIAGGARWFHRKAPGGGFSGTWREKAEAARDRFRDVSRPETDGEGITPGCPDDGGSSADTFLTKPPPD